ncbi:hypothetical protein [Pseudoalteromonas denitrificans]|uniref:Uncharacterized protein n=1 Tax=Pseudoalteromonas denitrificans DSM 6059 TaxID=1123010 RepID=A0A1I1NJD4_9GAMM|nr:hypothetical protein [Pseudoalteromonas denitrificans]SFC97657.1 hypothetical protein SAMN02745724_03085 [Pseudoalteromonas denitrificans DSM 6059]
MLLRYELRKGVVKYLSLLILSVFLFGCAQGRLDVLDNNGQIVGSCSADFNFHWYGAQHSVNYILYICAKEHIENGLRVSDNSILVNDYTIPKSPKGNYWNKNLAKRQFSNDLISEEKLGYILAHVEYQYWMKLKNAKDKLSQSVINQVEYDRLVEKAKVELEGI